MKAEKLKNPIFLFNACLLIVFIILDLIANTYGESARQFPRFVLGIGIVVLVFWMVIYFLFPSAMRFIEAQEEVEGGDSRNPSRYWLAWFCIAISVLIGYLFGFLFTVPSGFLSYGLILGDRKKLLSLSILTVISTVIFYIAFDYILHIPLLQGVFVDLG